jgi:hypothetical protein
MEDGEIVVVKDGDVTVVMEDGVVVDIMVVMVMDIMVVMEDGSSYYELKKEQVKIFTCSFFN